jgi:murein DD-endopeptidase MepM/ murein hydrolase activator NlpD
LSSCATTCGPFDVIRGYGAPVSYAEGKHPGIDFDIRLGTPIIAASDGVVISIGKPDYYVELWRGGISVVMLHGKHFKTFDAHMTKIFVEKGNSIKRGQLIGLSGASNNMQAHPHFGICKIGESCIQYSKTYDPKEFWLGGKAQCFDPNKDYSIYSRKDLTFPIACGEYAKELVTRTERKD